MDMTEVLPCDCISNIISFTSPKDAARSSLVSPAFKQAADSDAAWRRFLPSDFNHILANSSDPNLNLNLNSLPAKQLYLHLSDHPLLLADGNMKSILLLNLLRAITDSVQETQTPFFCKSANFSFWLEKESGKKCYMIGAKGLGIIWGDTPLYWAWTSIPESRFSLVATLKYVWWFEVRGSFSTKVLSPKTAYTVVFHFKFEGQRRGFKNRHVDFTVNHVGSLSNGKRVILDPPGDGVHQREDGWMEVEMGDFFNENDDDLVEFRIGETNCGYTKSDIVIEGVEFRPKKQ